jgi:G:T-mismatch repair DNA endonuclease (very short patch repair protein)/endogenous inhibitor of DNA gyrase (YacG/DUF329 family)
MSELENIKHLKEFYKQNNFKPNSMKFKKWLNDNQPIKAWLEQLLVNHSNLTSIYIISYCLANDIDLQSFKCKTCGKPLIIKKISIEKNYCSATCAAHDPDFILKRKETISKDTTFYQRRQEKIKQTCLEKYGETCVSKVKEFKEKMKSTISKDTTFYQRRQEKIKQTCLEKYGVENVSSNKTIRKKVKETFLKNYGVDNPNKLPETLEKVKKTCLEKYGVDCQFKRKEIIEINLKKSWERILSWQDYVVPLFSFEDYSGYSKNQKYKWKCAKCGHIFEQNIYHTRIFDLSAFIPRCTICYPHNTVSYLEKEVVDFLKPYFNDLIENDRSIIAPNELDIVIPSKKIAIEFNGSYWHSEQAGKDKNYHINKTLACEEAGYKLIHIWEYDWMNQLKQNIIKKKLKAILGVEQERVFARKCTIKEISTQSKNKFLNENHIQGEDKSVIKLGLFNNNELVAVMTFGKPRFNKKYEYELIRYATSKHVIGGAGKLLKYFERNYSPKSIITYADRSYSQGNLYNQLGFIKMSDIAPSYNWIKNNIFVSRFQSQKQRLEKILGDKFNKNMSEIENMKFNGFNRIYNCGNLVFVKTYES